MYLSHMIFEQHFPTGILSKYIDHFVFFEGYTAEHRADKLLPDGGIYLIMNMLEKPERLYQDLELTKYEEFTGSFISGQHKSYIFIEADHGSNMATRFKPGGAHPFFDFPISRLNNKVQQLEPILGSKVENCRKQIIAEKDVRKKFQLLETFYLGLLRPDYVDNHDLFNVLQTLEEEPDKANVAQFSKIMGLSQKQLLSIFNKQVGLNPKSLIRIFRFQKVIQALEKNEKIDWLQVATDCGYYDQAHFVKDFYAFSGITPGLYPEQKGDYLNYIPID